MPAHASAVTATAAPARRFAIFSVRPSVPGRRRRRGRHRPPPRSSPGLQAARELMGLANRMKVAAEPVARGNTPAQTRPAWAGAAAGLANDHVTITGGLARRRRSQPAWHLSI